MGSVSERRIRSIKGELLIWKSIFQFFLDLDLASNSSIKLLIKVLAKVRAKVLAKVLAKHLATLLTK
jgi:hypothetical protein